MLQRLRLKLANLLLKKLFNTITEEDILKVKEGKYYMEGQALTNDAVNELVREARFFKRSLLWKVMTNNIQFMANELMYRKSQTVNDLIFGKAILFNVGEMNKILDKFYKEEK